MANFNQSFTRYIFHYLNPSPALQKIGLVSTLSLWFGIENNRIPEAIPYINNFPERYLKFI